MNIRFRLVTRFCQDMCSRVDFMSPEFCEDKHSRADHMSPEFCDDVTYMGRRCQFSGRSQTLKQFLDRLSMAQEHNGWIPKYEELPTVSDETTSSKEKAPRCELKPLPAGLNYAFLGEDETYPMVISSKLELLHEGLLLKVLKDHKTVIGWTLSYIKGISSLVCIHQNFLEEDAKLVRQAQRRLNPTMKEVVQKEVLKLWDAGIVYPISDSKWVSLTQVVLKKSGVTVVENDNGEMVPNRVTTG
ncbi:hypothetical protein L3X38_045457 [Prunus dulcis]|uniref:Reverse transcriptase RNase H-like domain-containing protein n=1 Tax=Prunus dulcis TaxID=3755 RepID=A0AAD4YP18_PRUDU|nr:hypothetical protein L3X38_045457 [Prunus dulcis]